ncbi:hypothetical protein KY290_013639 [Solanum tuberosum]|uniref:Uncharacterized protein n=1 Tax=Solanum tuberosum TaxID=4113 RepID=A0ABQ7VMJ6_SOLTU|nr:hypothetical protein KY289_013770 [Solanum tuberosum]KAH0769658.1 hypothetical protein KY290_013639 [Solanum tuberosum]
MRVEIDLMKPLITEIQVTIKSSEGQIEAFNQKIEYQNIPEFCIHCKIQGHTKEKCEIVHQIYQQQKQNFNRANIKEVESQKENKNNKHKIDGTIQNPGTTAETFSDNQSLLQHKEMHMDMNCQEDLEDLTIEIEEG